MSQTSPRLDVASLLWVNRLPLLKADSLLAVFTEPNEEAEFIGRLKRGTKLHVIETFTQADGSRFGKIVPKGDDAPLGWINLNGIVPIYGRPIYEVVKPPVVRADCALTSKEVGLLPLGTRLHVVESRRLSDGAQRVRVAIVGEEDLLGWLTAKKPSTDTVTIRELKEDEFGSLGMEKWASMDGSGAADAAVDVGDGEVEATGGFTPRYVPPFHQSVVSLRYAAAPSSSTISPRVGGTSAASPRFAAPKLSEGRRQSLDHADGSPLGERAGERRRSPYAVLRAPPLQEAQARAIRGPQIVGSCLETTMTDYPER